MLVVVIARHYTPQPPLSNFVELLWLYEGYSQPHDKERLLPDGSMELVVNLKDDEARVYDRRDPGKFQSTRGALLVGVQSEYFVLDTAEQQSVIGAHFKPGGAFPFFKMPAGEFHNQHLSLDQLWGNGAGELRERLLATEGAEARLLLLERALLSLLQRPHSRHAAVSHALAAFRRGPRRIADVVDETGLSPRRFIRLFSDEVGLTPKSFCRIRRFQRTVALLHRANAVDWADTALTCGYSDQSHMIHDFQDFAGLSPANYLARRTEHMNHVPQ